MKKFFSYFALVLSIVGFLLTCFCVIYYGINRDFDSAFRFSVSCALFLWAILNSFELVRMSKDL